MTTSVQKPKTGLLGYCLDSGAARGVVGEKQYQQLCIGKKHQLKIRKSDRVFKFWTSTFPSLEIFTKMLKVNGERYLKMEIEAVSGDFPLLIGLEIMNLHGLVLDYGSHILSNRSIQWSLTITYARGHLLDETNRDEVMFTKPEVEKLHLRFYHPSSGKLFNLLKRVNPIDTDASVKKMLDDISKACSTCSDFQTSPFRFRH